VWGTTGILGGGVCSPLVHREHMLNINVLYIYIQIHMLEMRVQEFGKTN
jgi:hypothetical protein